MDSKILTSMPSGMILGMKKHEDGSITLTRKELYDKVWATPMRHLAKEFGLSDVGLAK